MKTSEAIRGRLRLAAGPIAAATRELLAHPEAARAWLALLVRMHQIARAALPVLEAARSRAVERAPADPVCDGLARYLATHVEDERHHDEWLLADLAAVGAPRAVVLAQIPSPETAAMVGAQYYWIHHHHPLAVLGYVAVLEGTPPTEDLLAGVQARSGLPDAAFRTYRHHVAVDPEHSRALDRVLDELPLEEPHLSLLGLSLLHTSSSFAICLGEVARGLTT